MIDSVFPVVLSQLRVMALYSYATKNWPLRFQIMPGLGMRMFGKHWDGETRSIECSIYQRGQFVPMLAGRNSNRSPHLYRQLSVYCQPESLIGDMAGNCGKCPLLIVCY
jgi:hypothetical protein